MDAETRAYLDQALGALREAFGVLSTEVGTLRAEVGTLREEVRDSVVEVRRHFDVVAEALRHDIRGVAEGVIVTFERVDRLGDEFRAEMDQRFAASHAVVRVAFQEVRRDIAELRARL